MKAGAGLMALAACLPGLAIRPGRATKALDLPAGILSRPPA